MFSPAVLLHIFTYILFRIVQKCVSCIQALLSAKDDDIVVTYSVAARMRFAEQDVGRPIDFILSTSERIDEVEVVRDGRWTAYACDSKNICLVRMPKPLTDYPASEYPFLRCTAFELAERVCFIQLDRFIALVQKHTEDSSSRIVNVGNTARSGTTLLCTLLGNEKSGVITLPEPCDVVCELQFQEYKGMIDLKRFGQIGNAVMRHMARTALADKAIVFKQRARNTRFSAALAAVNPRLRHIFLYRQNVEKVVTSNQKYLVAGYYAQTWFTLRRISSEFLVWILGNSTIIPGLWSAAEPSDIMDIAFYVYGEALQQYHISKDHIAYKLLSYEEMITPPRKTVAELLCFVRQVDSVSKEVVDCCLKALKQDSQATSVVGRAKLQKVESADISAEKMKKLEELFEKLGIRSVLNIETLTVELF